MCTAAEFNTADRSLRNRAVREMVMKTRTVPHATMTDEEWEVMSVLPEWATLMGPRHSLTKEQILERSAIVLDIFSKGTLSQAKQIIGWTIKQRRNMPQRRSKNYTPKIDSKSHLQKRFEKPCGRRALQRWGVMGSRSAQMYRYYVLFDTEKNRGQVFSFNLCHFRVASINISAFMAVAKASDHTNKRGLKKSCLRVPKLPFIRMRAAACERSSIILGVL
jgi:hypothetical protein